MEFFDVIILGGGAAGIFASINCAIKHPNKKILVLEKTEKLLTKVRISGGGRCNVTHACFDPKKLIQNYPRGQKELLGPFHTFQPQDTIKWFKNRNVLLKTESDGRMFPTTNASDTIINCLLNETKKHHIVIRTGQHIESITKKKHFEIHLRTHSAIECDSLILATGSSKKGYAFAEHLGHSIVKPIPSLFTLNIPSSPLLNLAGLSVDPVHIKVASSKQEHKGPLLLTHWGFSGPAALKLSAWEARNLFEKSYSCDVIINWIPESECMQLVDMKKRNESQSILRMNPHKLPKKLWTRFIELCEIDPTAPLSKISNAKLRKLTEKLHHDVYQLNGKTTHKEEFVTSGGIPLHEVHFKTMESKKCPQLYFAGEILNIDGVTGGFNFQNAWTTAWIASDLK